MKVKIIITGLSLLAACAYYSFFSTLWFIAGACWGLINLYFIKQLLYELLIANPKNLLKMALCGLIKFPALYIAGFGLLYYQPEASWPLLGGFTAVLALSTQKRFWKAFQHLERGLV